MDIPSQSQISFPSVLQQKSQLPKEVEQGNVEYKLKLISPSADRLEHLKTQMKWRLNEGSGEAFYEIGISDSGILVGLDRKELDDSISTLTHMAKSLNANISIIRERIVEHEKKKFIAEVLVRKSMDEMHFLEIKIALVGGYDVGKSTLLGVLAHDEKDNGKGKARLNLLKHRHEIASGRTSSISKSVIGFDSHGQLINFATTNISSVEQICESSSKIVTFLDTCGHPKYQKTTISGLTGQSPDYACLIVSANSGSLCDTSKEQLGIATILAVPVFVCITKVDVTTPSQLSDTMTSLLSLLKAPGLRKVPTVIQNEDDVVASISSFLYSKVTPIFLVSNVTGENIPLLTQFLNLLPKSHRLMDPMTSPSKTISTELNELRHSEFQIEEVYNIPDVGHIVEGILLTGQILLSPQSFFEGWLGPDKGEFYKIRIASIHRQRRNVGVLYQGQAATCSILFETNHGFDAFNRPNQFKIRKGQVILLTKPTEAFWEFEAQIYVLYHEQILNPGHQGVLYCGNIRQGVSVVSIQPFTQNASHSSSDFSSQEVLFINSIYQSSNPSKLGLHQGQRGLVRFRFLTEPEWLVVGRTILFRGQGRVKCVGKITNLYGESSQLRR